MKSNPDLRPFWKDEITYNKPAIIPGINYLILIYGIISAIIIFGMIFFLIYQLTPILAWVWLLFLLTSLSFGFINRKRIRIYKREILFIQEQAKQRTGAVAIGSAIHVAGHPFLEREQPVVLALITGKGICFYKYDNDLPFDIIAVEDIISIHTVVYDDERTPHIDVVDTTAQALQIIFSREEKEFTMLLRSMKILHPIDWYQLLQKSRANVYI